MTALPSLSPPTPFLLLLPILSLGPFFPFRRFFFSQTAVLSPPRFSVPWYASANEPPDLSVKRFEPLPPLALLGEKAMAKGIGTFFSPELLSFPRNLSECFPGNHNLSLRSPNPPCQVRRRSPGFLPGYASRISTYRLPSAGFRLNLSHHLFLFLFFRPKSPLSLHTRRGESQ